MKGMSSTEIGEILREKHSKTNPAVYISRAEELRAKHRVS
jgi:hypothetical protein